MAERPTEVIQNISNFKDQTPPYYAHNLFTSCEVRILRETETRKHAYSAEAFQQIWECVSYNGVALSHMAVAHCQNTT